MDTEKQLQFSDNVIIIPFLILFSIWFVYWLELTMGFNFNKFGIYPRTIKGLRGVVFSPWIHSDFKHLFNNSIPLLALSSILLYFYREVAVQVFVFAGLFTGLLTWCIARESYHIGASGIIYLLFGFIFFSGVFKRHYRLVAISLITIFLYGSMVWYVFPIDNGISWEGHLSGLIIGLFFSVFYRKKGIVQERYEFTKTDFDDRFDEFGNYIPPSFEEE